ncbi:MAG TPA: diguanylate cyclase [Rhodocyclaceae bacterium]|nr:diguanylate cyclase [Rhodocyclaceae bacterium]
MLTSTLPDRPLLLIVDDEPRNVQLLYAIFKEDYRVCRASSGKEALEFCQARQPDLILLDLVMPEMSGYSVCQRLKSDVLTKNIPVIFVTAGSDPLEAVRGLDAGGVDFIIKPFHVEILRARVRSHLALKHQADVLRSLALIDGLTGVGNRRHFDNLLKVEWRRSIRSGQPLSLILVDVDFFKRYNDRYGHQAGDACLRSIAAVLSLGCLRSHDAVARYGGEEFICILPDTTQQGAENKANDLEMAIRSLRIAHEASDVCAVVTISLGVAIAHPVKGDSAADLVACADEQLYFAKRSGRGQMKSLHLAKHPSNRVRFDDRPPDRMRRTVAGLDAPAADQAQQDHDHGDHQQDMDEAP